MIEQLDEEIKEWRNTLRSHPGYQRAIDVIDALQQFRVRVFGSLLPLPDGKYKVSTDCGKNFSEHENAQEAIDIHAAANGTLDPSLPELNSVK